VSLKQIGDSPWRLLLIVVHRFVPDGKEDQVVQMLRALADECKAEMSEGK
jgi:hypothetical protein